MIVELTKEQWAVIIRLMDKVAGLENAKVLLPIYEAIQSAAKANDPQQG